MELVKSYELYKEEWIRDHVSEDELEEPRTEYERSDGKYNISFGEYIMRYGEEYGFKDGCYVCMNEFRDNEYQEV